MRLVSRMLIVAMLLALVVVPVSADQPHHKVYVCPMTEHAQEFDKPGACPLCGMALVEKGARLRVAVLVFQYAEDIDFTAPIEVLGQAGAQLFTVAATKDPVTTVFGLHLTPDYDIEHAPPSDVLLVPGGGINSATQDERVMAWVRERAAASRYVLSVCNGSFILAQAGLLDGLKATTTAGNIERLAALAPKTQVVRERVTDNGKVITSGGLSAGIDGALHLIEREYGRNRAVETARQIEYQWQPDSKWSRAELADMRMPDVKLPDDAKWEKLSSDGDTRHWEASGRLEVGMSAEAFLDYATKQIGSNGWTLLDSTSGKRTFSKTADGQKWVATLTSTRDGAGPAIKETMSIRADGASAAR